MARVARCDPNVLDLVTWAVTNGSRLFQRVQVNRSGIFATQDIPKYDFVAVVPTSLALSCVSLQADRAFPVKLAPENHGVDVSFWPDLSHGSLALVTYLAGALLSGKPRGVQSYLEVLPCEEVCPMATLAQETQRSSAYQRWASPLASFYGVPQEKFDATICRVYCLFRRHAIPFWSASGSSGSGHPYFSTSPFVLHGPGDIMGMVPLLDLATHSPLPNASIGFPDEEMMQWWAQQKGIGAARHDGYFVMQSLEDIAAGESLTVNKNAYFNFDDETFLSWFGYPNLAPAASIAPGRAEAETE